jgi:cytosine deaminase
MQLVALNVRLTGPECADMRAMLRTAMELGAEVVGGCPHLDPDPVPYHDITLLLAAELGRPIDLHTDETLNQPRYEPTTSLAHLQERFGATVPIE